jgi:hypothetical protein
MLRKKNVFHLLSLPSHALWKLNPLLTVLTEERGVHSPGAHQVHWCLTTLSFSLLIFTCKQEAKEEGDSIPNKWMFYLLMYFSRNIFNMNACHMLGTMRRTLFRCHCILTTLQAYMLFLFIGKRRFVEVNGPIQCHQTSGGVYDLLYGGHSTVQRL